MLVTVVLVVAFVELVGSVVELFLHDAAAKITMVT
jgi:hypothetical protein